LIKEGGRAVVELARAIAVLRGEGVAEEEHELVEAHKLMHADLAASVGVEGLHQALQRGRAQRDL
jgi:hypothetical protein